MATTLDKVLKDALTLMGRMPESGTFNYTALTDDNYRYYKAAPGIITRVQNDLLNCIGKEGAGVEISTSATFTTTYVLVNDDIASRVMPYGVAGSLAESVKQDGEMANYLNNKYEALKGTIKCDPIIPDYSALIEGMTE